MSSVAAGANLSPREYVTALARGVPVQVPCPSWCTTDHAASGPRDLESVAHASDSAWLSTAADAADMEVFISQYPFADGDSAPVLALDATGCGEFAELSSADARALIAQRRAQLDAFEALVDLVS